MRVGEGDVVGEIEIEFDRVGVRETVLDVECERLPVPDVVELGLLVFVKLRVEQEVGLEVLEEDTVSVGETEFEFERLGVRETVLDVECERLPVPDVVELGLLVFVKLRVEQEVGLSVRETVREGVAD